MTGPGHDILGTHFGVDRRPGEKAGEVRRCDDRLLDASRPRCHPEQGAGSHLVADTNRWQEVEPHRLLVGAGALLEPRRGIVQGAQDPVEHPAQQARTEAGRQRHPPRPRRCTRREPTRVLVQLRRDPLSVDGHDLAREPLRTHFDELEHRHVVEAAQLDQRTGDPGHAAPAVARSGRCRVAGHRHSASTFGPRAARQRSAMTGSR